MRKEEEIKQYLDEAFDKVWLTKRKKKVDILAIQKILDKYKDIPMDGYTDWECGYWNGILGALRWVLGDDKDSLDT